MTVKEHIDAAVNAARAAAFVDGGSREFALAITKLEEAQMWYTRGRAIQEDKFNPQDLDK